MEQINLYDLIKFYGRKWRVIVALTLAGLVAGLIYNTFIQVPMYESNAKLILVSPVTKQASSDQTLINNYIDLIKSRRVLEPIIDQHLTKMSYDQLSKSVQVTNQNSTEVIDVVVSTPNADESKQVANSITESFKVAVSSLYKDDNVAVVDPAVAAKSPSNVHKLIQLTLSTMIGVFVGLIVVFVQFDISRNTKTSVKKRTTKASLATKKPMTKKKAASNTRKR